ncbi:MAG TPA: hypothetical protein VGN14_17365 [Candidatus Elarobacter sp.]|jgi:hypothetical protein
MSTHRSALILAAFGCAAALAACGGGSGGGSAAPAGPGTTPVSTPTPTATPAGTATPTPTAQPQVITMALPSSVMGSTTSANGPIGGYTQTGFSQTLAFAPGSQVMLRNGQATTSHTLNVLSTTAFPTNPSLSAAASGSSIDQNFASGAINPDTTIGPFTLTAGTYFVGCAFHYVSDTMRTVLVVAAGATPGPQATPPGGTATPPPGYGY